MFCSVAVGKLRQAYKSPAIIRPRCTFKTLCVYVRVCVLASAGGMMSQRTELVHGCSWELKQAMKAAGVHAQEFLDLVRLTSTQGMAVAL